MELALGLVETKGLVAAIEAADAMVKAADVKIISKEKVTGALIIIKISGETAAVKSAVDAGAAAANRVGELVSAHVIPRPDNQIDSLLFDENLKEEKQTKKTPTVKEVKVVEKKTLEPKPEVIETPNPKIAIPKEVVKRTLKVEKKSSQKLPSMDDLVVLNVHGLRRIARGFDEFPIKGREISRANRAKLLDYFKSLQ